MEFLKVTVPGRKDRDINVLIDGEKSGKINEVIILGRGDILVSVDLPGAEEKVVDLRNTTPSHPKIVEIKV
jgi:HSP20 family molecular chaperone IbpA